VDKGQLLPDLGILLNSPSITRLELAPLAGLKPGDCFDVQLLGITSQISNGSRPFHLNNAMLLSPTPQHNATLLSLGGEGARSIMAARGSNAFGGPRLTSEELQVLLRTRLGLLPTPHVPAAGPCDLQGCKGSNDPTGTHALSCMSGGPDGGRSQRSRRHAEVKGALAKTLDIVAKRHGLRKVVHPKEPHPATLGWRPKPGWDPNTDPQFRGDILVTGPDGKSKILDVVISSTNPTTTKETASVAGFAARKAEERKDKQYADRWHIPPGCWDPFSVEAFGRMGKRGRKYLSDFARMCVGKERRDWDRSDLLTYAKDVKELLDSVAVATAKSVAQSLLASSRGGCHPLAPDGEREDGRLEGD
jgi:hypothetical protein